MKELISLIVVGIVISVMIMLKRYIGFENVIVILLTLILLHLVELAKGE